MPPKPCMPTAMLTMKCPRDDGPFSNNGRRAFPIPPSSNTYTPSARSPRTSAPTRLHSASLPSTPQGALETQPESPLCQHWPAHLLPLALIGGALRIASRCIRNQRFTFPRWILPRRQAVSRVPAVPACSARFRWYQGQWLLLFGRLPSACGIEGIVRFQTACASPPLSAAYSRAVPPQKIESPFPFSVPFRAPAPGFIPSAAGAFVILRG